MFLKSLHSLAIGFAAICTLPLLAAALAALSGDFSTWGKLASTVLPRYMITTLELVLMVGLASAAIGTACAWLVSTCRFPGVRLFEMLLALPLAFPAYVLAYAYTDLLDHPGLVQSALRALTGWGPRDYWFPEVRSVGGAALMLTFVFYPYVYLLARSAFLRQSPSAYYAARTLGRSPWVSFWRVSLPMARPAIAGGVLLVLMETLADYGTAAHFGVQTFATGIYRAWFSHGDQAAAAQLALCLLGLAILLIVVEETQRGAARTTPVGRKQEPPPQHELKGFKAALAFLVCLLPLLVGLVIPLLNLLRLAVIAESSWSAPRYLALIGNSTLLAVITALVVIVGAAVICFCQRCSRRPGAGLARRLAGLGYAVPGGVIAIGVLVPFGALDALINQFTRHYWGVSLGLLFSGSLLILVLAYTARFMAAGLKAVESGYSEIKPSFDAAARTMGMPLGPALFGKVHWPLLRVSMATGLLLVFVEVMKELPATLILRPFNFDTLAVQAYRLASDERLAAAAFPSLIIMLFGLIPMIMLSWQIHRDRCKRSQPSSKMVPAL